MTSDQAALPIVVLPLIGFLINGLLGNQFGALRQHRACGLPIAAFLIAALQRCSCCRVPNRWQTVFTWAQFADRPFEIVYYFDRLTAVMAQSSPASDR